MLSVISNCCYVLFSHSVMPNSFLTPWTVAGQAPLYMGLPRQEYWSGLPFPSPGIFPPPQGLNPGLLPGRWILYHWATWEAPSLFTKAMKIKTLMRYHFTVTWISIILLKKKKMENKCWPRCEETGNLMHYWYKGKMVWQLWQTPWQFLKKVWTQSYHMIQ